MIEIESVTIQLGEREYIVQEAGRARARAWKERLIAEVKPLFDSVMAAQSMQLAKPEDLLQLFPLVEDAFLTASDLLFELLVSYSPVLEEDRAYIEENATELQIYGGFQEVIRWADPFGMVSNLLRGIGRRRSTISSNSHSVKA